ncbi:hypothetical protein DL96DRAFT_1820397 [Flagelloscypha sp. PMI_526]|nr:hypothetical protein DL96DRAFT_1820397 [Flagelloscypha sp. PMI_526]
MAAATILNASASLVPLPSEIIQHIVSFVSDRATLKVVSLISHVFVLQAQANLFSRISLTGRSSESIQHIASSPHILRHIRSISADHEDLRFPALLDSFSDPWHEQVYITKLRELIIVSASGYNPWPLNLLQSLYGKTLASLSSLTLDSLNAPLFLVTSCTSLRCLRAYGSILYKEGDSEFRALFKPEEDPLTQLGLLPSSLESNTMPFLTTLALDGTENNAIRTCPLVELIQQRKFPALKYLDLSRNDAKWFPLPDIPKVVQPLMNQLVCLDIGYWPQWNNEHEKVDHSQDLDLFHIHHYPHLLFFSTRLQQERVLDRSTEACQMFFRLIWLYDGFKKLTSPHPLKVLRLQLAADWFENVGIDTPDSIESESLLWNDCWESLDFTLKGNQHLDTVEKVIIPILPKFRMMRGLLRDRLPTLNDAGKLSFELTDVGDQFLSVIRS